jgi:hypothetical protein
MDLAEPTTIKVTATTSSNTPSVRNIRMPGVIILNLRTAITPIPYERSERVIINAPIIANGFIFGFYQIF